MNSQENMDHQEKNELPITCPECEKIATNWRGNLYPVSASGGWVECLERRGGCGHIWYVVDIPAPNREQPRRASAAIHRNEDGSVTIDVQEAMLSGNFEGTFLDAFAQSLSPPQKENGENK